MSYNPVDIAREGHRYQVIVRNDETAIEVVADRVQSVDPRFTANLEKAYELGNVDPVGTATDPTEYTVVVEDNLHNSEVDLVLAGQDPTSGSAFCVADFVTNDDLHVYIVIRDNSDNLTEELAYTDGVLAEITWRFVVGGACTTSITINTAHGCMYSSGSVTSGSGLIHTTWGASDLVSPGIVKGKDARICLGGTSEAANRTYRLQSFSVRAAFPVTAVRELGTRSLVGQLIGPPDVTVDFDLLMADHQPTEILTNLSSGSICMSFDDLAEFNAAIRLYDPDQAQSSANVLKAWVLENLRVSGGTPVRAQVRGLATMRYTCTVGRATTPDCGGLKVYTTGDIP